MRAPSFYCDEETESGLKLHYRSKRRGFVYYVMGQIKQVAKQFYHQECEILLISEVLVGETMHVVFQLNFDNSAFTEAESIKNRIAKGLQLPVQAATLFELFPFCIVFNQNMEITHTGHALMTILKDLVGQIMTEAFDMTRPLIPFCFTSVMQRRNNIFELVTVAPIHDVNCFFKTNQETEETEGTRLHIRGQMLYMLEWDMMLYLANPVMPHLGSLVDAGLFVNDLSLHDCSRDFVLAGTQQSVELKLALDQEQQKSRKLVESMKKLDEERTRTDELLYQMIPKQVADRIRRGENPVDTSQTFEMVSILFSNVVNFTDICSKIRPMQVVTMLNHMYSLFDQLTARHGGYKVETIGDSYMVVSGAPEVNVNHAERIADMALDMIDASDAIEDPSSEGMSLKVRIGCHSGTCVGGVVGLRTPRYCLFGESVSVASKMESTAEASRIQLSEACKSFLPPTYQTLYRGNMQLKETGTGRTYWLIGREGRTSLTKYHSSTIRWSIPSPAPVLPVEEVTHRQFAPTTFKSFDVVAAVLPPLAISVIPPKPVTDVTSYIPPNLETNINLYKTPARQSVPTRSSGFVRTGRLSTTSSSSTLYNSFARGKTAIQTYQNSVTSENQSQQTEFRSSVTPVGKIGCSKCSGETKETATSSVYIQNKRATVSTGMPSSLAGPVELFYKPPSDICRKADNSQKFELHPRKFEEIPQESETVSNQSCKMGVLFFHNCSATGAVVDNPTISTTSSGMLMITTGKTERQKGSYEIEKSSIETERVVVQQHQSGPSDLSNAVLDFGDIYLTQPVEGLNAAMGRNSGTINDRVVSRTCNLL